MKNIFAALVTLAVCLTACDSPETKNETPSTKNQPAEPIEVPQRKPTGEMVAIDSLSRVLKADPDNQEAYLMRADLLLKRREAQSAANDIYNAMQLDSSSAKARLLKGQLHFIQNRTRLSKIEWEKCIKLEPQNVECRLKLAELYIVVMDFETALKLLDEVIRIDNKNPEAYFFKGMVMRDLKQDTALALQYFQRAIDLKQDYVRALDMMGVMLSARNDTLAKYYFQRILEMEPNRADIYFKLGVFYMSQNEINRALENYTKAVQLNPRDADSYFNLGFMHVELKQYEKASEYFTKAIEVRDKNYKAYYGRGYCYEMSGQFKKAKEDYRKAIESNPVYRPAGVAMERVNRALEELRKNPESN